MHRLNYVTLAISALAVQQLFNPLLSLREEEFALLDTTVQVLTRTTAMRRVPMFPIHAHQAPTDRTLEVHSCQSAQLAPTASTVSTMDQLSM